MMTDFSKYSLSDFLNNSDFCEWVKGDRPVLDETYNRLLSEFPEQEPIFSQARQLLVYLEGERSVTPNEIKTKNWNNVYNIYRTKKIKSRKMLFIRYAAILVLGVFISSLAFYVIERRLNNEYLSSLNIKDYSETTLISGENKMNILGYQSMLEYSKNGTQLKINNEFLPQREADKTEMNQLIVPYGHQSKIILSDKTIVWLNAGSRLIYPSKFNHNKRYVQIQGEAYFDVAKDKSRPFIVETNKAKIKVLGTSFNIRSFPNEQIEETTLVEGTIRMDLKNIFGSDIILKPDERVLIKSNNSFYKSHVDIQKIISWRDGILSFKEEPLFNVLDELSVFYGVKIKSADEVIAQNKKITGKLDLKRGQQHALKSLEFILNGEFIKKDNIIILKLNI